MDFYEKSFTDPFQSLVIEKLHEINERLERLEMRKIYLDNKKSVTISEAAKELGKSYDTIRRLIKEGRLEVVEGRSPTRVTMRSINKLR